MGLEHFGRPLYLLLLVLVPAAALLARRSLAGLPPFRRRLAVALRCLVVALLVLALAETRLVLRNQELAVMYAVDVSASIPPEHREAALDFVRASARSRDPRRGDWVGLMVFGRNAGIEVSPRRGELAFESLNTLIEKDFTDLQGAIRLAAAVFPEGAARRLVLISDGAENRGKALEEARAAREEGIELHVLPISYRYEDEVLVDKVVVDPEVHQGEPFEVRVVVESTRPSRAMLRLFENGSQAHAQEVDLKTGKNVFVVPRRLEKDGLYSYEAAVEALDRSGDAILQNNSAHGFTFIRGLPRVLLCAGDPAGEPALEEALRQERIHVETVSPEGLPEGIEGFLAHDAVILSDVPAHRLSPDRLKMFESLVKAVGVGLVMVGGPDSFGAGGYQSTPVEDLLPVSMDIKQKKVLPNGALAVVMHSCEINNGNFWAKETVRHAIRVLSPQDFAGVLFYDGMGGERWLFPMTKAIEKAMMLARLQGFTPGDMPDFSRIVQMAHTGLKGTKASLKHIIVLSDGDPNPPTAAQIQAIRQDGITISTVCMGWHSSPVAMRNLARAGGGMSYEISDPQKLPAIFIREATTVRKSLISERDFQPLARSAASFLRGIDLGALPALKGYVITSHKESAEGVLTAPPVEGDPLEDPILSAWAYGLGKSVAFTSDAGKRWAQAWPSWGDYRRFWGQMVRWVSRRSSAEGLRASRSLEGEQGSLVLDAVDEAGNFINGIAFEGAVVDPDFQSRPVEVRQVAPGRYRADFPVGRKGTYLVSLRHEKDGASGVYSTGLTVPYSPEYRHLGTQEDLLKALAGASGGKVLDPAEPGAVFSRDFQGARSARDLWRGLLEAAALLFFLDIFVRRVHLDPKKLLATSLARVRSLVARRRAPVAPDERLQALLRKKGEVRAAGGKRFYEAKEAAVAAGELDRQFVAGAAAPLPPREAAARQAEERPAAPPEKSPVKSTVESREKARDKAREEESTYTGRLLAAKKRALDDRQGKG